MSDTRTLDDMLDELVQEAQAVERYGVWDRHKAYEQQSREFVEALRAEIKAHCESGRALPGGGEPTP